MNTCHPADVYLCVQPALQDYINQELYKKCDCRAPCDQIFYKATVSSSTQSNFLVEYLQQVHFNYTIPNQFVRDNFLILKVYFSDLSLESINTAAAYSVLSLLCDIGGTLGLCLGSSFLTLFEFGDFILIWMLKKCCTSSIKTT